MRFALINMPWASPTEPILGLSSLKACLVDAGHEARVFNFNVSLLNELSYETYRLVSDDWALCDFLFSGELDTDLDSGQIASLLEICEEAYKREQGWRDKDQSVAEMLSRIMKIRADAIPKFLKRCLTELLSYEPDAFGFTCSFDQTIAAAALSRKIADQSPEAQIFWGGYAVDGDVGRHMLSVFSFVSGVVMGDGERAIVQIANSLENGVDLLSVPELLTSESGTYLKRDVFLDETPGPDFQDYFDDIDELRASSSVSINNRTVPIECSRGCWWGQKNHCVFCGIDKDTLKYRTKSDDQFLNHIRNIRETWGDKTIRLVDYIFPFSKEDTLLPALAEETPLFQFSTETKSNTNLSKFKKYVDAGFSEFQPGIESFSTAVLKGMRKGVSAAQNVLFLVLGRQHDCTVHFNILYGFPFDCPIDYKEMTEALPSLYHLSPPETCTQVFTTRYAPMQTEADELAIRDAKIAHKRYDVIFSKTFRAETGFCADRFCYYYETHQNNNSRLDFLYSILGIQARHWQDSWLQKDVPTCEFQRRPEALAFIDTRIPDQRKELTLVGLDMQVYLECHLQVTNSQKILRSLSISEAGDQLSAEMVQGSIERLVEARLIFRENSQLVGLGIDSQSRQPTSHANERHRSQRQKPEHVRT